LDILFEKYLDVCFEEAGFDEQMAFLELLKLPDAQLLTYFLGEQTPDKQALALIVQKIRIMSPSSAM
ncbi:MAG: succinate dehydrogenase assembly factor 2, partial [Victivallales bacterium]|nr:succinate dehydrogenase assembly factor 2 [Victivallales bacterium]